MLRVKLDAKTSQTSTEITCSPLHLSQTSYSDFSQLHPALSHLLTSTCANPWAGMSPSGLHLLNHTDIPSPFKCHLVYAHTSVHRLSSCVSSGHAKQILVQTPCRIDIHGCRGSAQADQHQAEVGWGRSPCLKQRAQSLSKLP